jgi:hypothetical protein
VPVFIAWIMLLAAPLVAGPGAEVWQELLSSKPKGTGVLVTGVVLARDAFTFRLDSGTFFPLSEVAGRVAGGLFKGRGRFELKPATENERANLALHFRTKDLQILADTFEEAVFLFTDQTGKELLTAEPTVPGDPAKLGSIYDRALKKAVKDLKIDPRLRLVPDLIEAGADSRGLFLACFEAAKLPPALAVFSPRGVDRTWLMTETGAETTALIVIHEERGGIWYSERPIGAPDSVTAPPSPDLDALHYSVDTTIRKNTDIEGRTTLRLRCGRAGLRVVPLDLFAKLRISEVRLKRPEAPAVEVPFIQGDEKSRDPVLAVLPAALASGEEVEVTADYQGDEILHAAGENNYYVDARENWYPGLKGIGDCAVYDLTYRIPKKRQVVSVGKLRESAEDGDFAVYRFTSEQPVRAAGFNYGNFQLVERDDPDSGVKIRVYANPGRPDAVQGIHYDPVSMAEDILADSLNTARVCTAYFGALPLNDIAVTQQTQWTYGQSWPTLIYIPFMAFLDWVTRANLGLSGESVRSFVEEVTPHEFAHQWWGHLVGAATYRDVWLTEGLAEFTVSLVVERALGAKEFRNFWERARKNILDTPLKSVCANWKAGPISLGTRLVTAETLGAYSAVVYSKGAFVIHMLRGLFWDGKNADHDHRFVEMMKDFAKTWAGRNPTTADFQAVVERHAPAPFTGNMGWFFRQWIDGTALPKIEASIRVDGAGEGRFRLAGGVTQSGVPDDFQSIVPLYFEFEKGRLVRFAKVSVTGNKTVPVQGEIALPKKPLRVLVNPNLEWLTRD